METVQRHPTHLLPKLCLSSHCQEILVDAAQLPVTTSLLLVDAAPAQSLQKLPHWLLHSCCWTQQEAEHKTQAGEGRRQQNAVNPEAVVAGEFPVCHNTWYMLSSHTWNTVVLNWTYKGRTDSRQGTPPWLRFFNAPQIILTVSFKFCLIFKYIIVKHSIQRHIHSSQEPLK